MESGLSSKDVYRFVLIAENGVTLQIHARAPGTTDHYIAMKQKTSAKLNLSRQGFLKLKKEIEEKKFHSVESNILCYGVERTRFEKDKLRRLIALSESVPSKTVQAAAERWKRKLAKAEKAEARFEQMKRERPVSRPLAERSSFAELLKGLPSAREEACPLPPVGAIAARATDR